MVWYSENYKKKRYFTYEGLRVFYKMTVPEVIDGAGGSVQAEGGW